MFPISFNPNECVWNCHRISRFRIDVSDISDGVFCRLPGTLKFCYLTSATQFTQVHRKSHTTADFRTGRESFSFIIPLQDDIQNVRSRNPRQTQSVEKALLCLCQDCFLNRLRQRISRDMTSFHPRARSLQAKVFPPLLKSKT